MQNYFNVGILYFVFTKIKGADINLHSNSPTFRAAKSKGFTVRYLEIQPKPKEHIIVSTINLKQKCLQFKPFIFQSSNMQLCITDSYNL